jgi:hypothetical protein
MRGPLDQRLEKARAAGNKDVAERARRGLAAMLSVERSKGTGEGRLAADIASGAAAAQIGRIGLGGTPAPTGLACAQGCAFCCILPGRDGGLITEAEASALHAALSGLDGPDGRDWHPQACAALDPETRTCRAYDARPMICRAYVSTDAAACEAVSTGEARPGPGTLGPYHVYLSAIALSRAAMKGTARVATYALARVTAAACTGKTLEDTLAAARHKPAELEAELKRSARDTTRAAGLP